MKTRYLVPGDYMADPSVHVFNGRLYIYPSHDRQSIYEENDNGDHFDMKDYHVFSTDDVMDGEVVDHGKVLDVDDIPWHGRQLWDCDVAEKDGKYFMYWGEHAVYAATSDDLVNWTPILDEKNELATVIKPRPQYFDSALTECGPPAILTDKGIVLLYNGKNQTNDSKRDKRFTAGAYCAGQILTDPKEPMKVLQRLDVPFFRPMASFEKSGQYVDGTVFIEGLVFFKNKWYLYYGCADSQVSVAIYDPAKKTPGDQIPN